MKNKYKRDSLTQYCLHLFVRLSVAIIASCLCSRSVALSLLQPWYMIRISGCLPFLAMARSSE